MLPGAGGQSRRRNTSNCGTLPRSRSMRQPGFTSIRRSRSRHGGAAQFPSWEPMNVQDEPEAASLLARAAGGDVDAWGALLARHQERLRCVVSFRLDPRLRGRVDAADVLQDAFIAATERRSAFFAQSTQPLFLWLRWMVSNTLLEVHRHHLGARMRDPRREVAPGRGSNGNGRADGDDDDST